MTTEVPMGSVVESVPPTAPSTVGEVEPPESSKKVLTAPTPPSWLDSSLDLLTGCTARDFEDTIPGALFDELFGDDGDPR